jgi:hypothetical protein
MNLKNHCCEGKIGYVLTNVKRNKCFCYMYLYEDWATGDPSLNEEYTQNEIANVLHIQE